MESKRVGGRGWRLWGWVAVSVVVALVGSGAYLYMVAPDGGMPAIGIRGVEVAPTPEFDGVRTRIKALVDGVWEPEERGDAVSNYLGSLWLSGSEEAAFMLSDAEGAALAALVDEFQDRELPPAPSEHWFSLSDLQGIFPLISVYIHAEGLSPEETCRALIAGLNLSAGYENELGPTMGVGLATIPMELALLRGWKLQEVPPELLGKLRDGLWARVAPEAPPKGFGDRAYLMAEGWRRQNAKSWRAVLPDGCLERYAAKVDAEARANNLLGLKSWLTEQPRLLSPCGGFVYHLWLEVSMELDTRAEVGMICCALSGALTPGGLSAYLGADTVEGPDYRQDPYAPAGTRFRLETTDSGQRLVSIGPGYYPVFSEEHWERTLEIGKAN